MNGADPTESRRGPLSVPRSRSKGSLLRPMGLTPAHAGASLPRCHYRSVSPPSADSGVVFVFSRPICSSAGGGPPGGRSADAVPK